MAETATATLTIRQATMPDRYPWDYWEVRCEHGRGITEVRHGERLTSKRRETILFGLLAEMRSHQRCQCGIAILHRYGLMLDSEITL